MHTLALHVVIKRQSLRLPPFFLVGCREVQGVTSGGERSGGEEREGQKGAGPERPLHLVQLRMCLQVLIAARFLVRISGVPGILCSLVLYHSEKKWEWSDDFFVVMFLF